MVHTISSTPTTASWPPDYNILQLTRNLRWCCTVVMIVMVTRYSSTNNFRARECLKLSRKKIVGTFAFALTLHGIQINLVGDFAAVKTNQIITG